ncbi:short-chain dehydrogenase/reductase [Rhodococcus coprophilus]|uniref:short-chain dehydrogenase/reductase n=1 Tax=Rhodococcus coprophilus TaxID=38310 RepID=UPI00379304B1
MTTAFVGRRPRMNLAGKVALVTGAAQGIGRAVAEDLAAQQVKVAIVDVDRGANEALAAALGDRTLAITADVRDRQAMTTAVASTVSRFGGLDVVVANAGVTPTPATLRTMSDDEFDRTIGINLTGVYNTVRPALDHIVAAGGHVVVVSSCAAFAPGAGGSPYMISKSAAEQLGRALRVELAAHGATAGVAYFGLVDTAMTHDMLDADDLGREVGKMLPWPLNRRITTRQAAGTIVDGIRRRAPMTVAPAGWRQYSWLRGLVNPVIDRRMASDSRLHRLLRELEARVR